MNVIKQRKVPRYNGKPGYNAPRNVPQQPPQRQGGAAGAPKLAGVSVHDETDIMSFRHSTAGRFIHNQELLEAVLERNVPLALVIAPHAYPELEAELVWVGNLEKVKQEAETKSKEIAELKQQVEDQAKLFVEESSQEKLGLLRVLKLLFDEPEKHEAEVAKAQNEYRKVHKKQIRQRKFVRKTISGLRAEDYSEAPPGWYERQEELRLELQRRKEEELRQKLQQEEEMRQRLEQQRIQREQEEQRKQQEQQAQQAQQAQQQAQQLAARQSQQQQHHQQQQVHQQQHNMPFNSQPQMVPAGGENGLGFGYAPNSLGLGTDVFNDDLPVFMDDDGFGLDTLEDSDFLSQMDHSME